MNIAAVHQLPVVFVVHRNGWTQSVKRESEYATDSLVARAAGYGMPGIAVDGTDVEAMFAPRAARSNVLVPAADRPSSTRSASAFSPTPRTTTTRAIATARHWSRSSRSAIRWFGRAASWRGLRRCGRRRERRPRARRRRLGGAQPHGDAQTVAEHAYA